MSKGRQALRVEARSLLCYIAVRDLKRSVTDLTRVAGMTPSAISYAVAWRKRIADEKRLRLEELLKGRRVKVRLG